MSAYCHLVSSPDCWASVKSFTAVHQHIPTRLQLSLHFWTRPCKVRRQTFVVRIDEVHTGFRRTWRILNFISSISHTNAVHDHTNFTAMDSPEFICQHYVQGGQDKIAPTETRWAPQNVTWQHRHRVSTLLCSGGGHGLFQACRRFGDV